MVIDCWACSAQLPHAHRAGQDCAHAYSSGDWRSCCADAAADVVALLVAARRGAPDSPAGLVLADNPEGPDYA